jgi:hypothetical protein
MGGFSKVVSLAKDKGFVKPVKPTPPKPVNPTPPKPAENKIKKEKEKKASNMLLAKRKGRRYSIATSAKGDLAKVETTKKTLLG